MAGGRLTWGSSENLCDLGGFRVMRLHLSLVSGRAFGGIGAVGGGVGSFDPTVDFGGGIRVFSGGCGCQVGRRGDEG